MSLLVVKLAIGLHECLQDCSRFSRAAIWGKLIILLYRKRGFFTAAKLAKTPPDAPEETIAFFFYQAPAAVSGMRTAVRSPVTSSPPSIFT